MKKDEKIAIVRILSDLIKADSIIDSGEINQYMLLRERYSIDNNNENIISNDPKGNSLLK